MSTKKTGTPKRAPVKKTTKTSKRAASQEKTGSFKRAAPETKTTTSKRVEKEKDTKASKRVAEAELPESIERVELNEDDVLGEIDAIEPRLWGEDPALAVAESTEGVNLSGSDRPISMLRMLADTYMQTQRLRIQTTNRLNAVERGVDQPMEGYLPDTMKRLAKRLNDAEKECTAAMENALVGHPAMEWLSQVAGVGPVLAAKILAMIDIRRCNTISALWRFSGYGVVDGKRERPIKGEKLHYCIRLKTAMYLAGGSFLKLKDKSPYRRIYDESRVFYSANRPDWTEGHRHAASMRRMIKLFIAHLWLTWREAEGLPVRTPYVIEKLGHTTVEDPWNYVRPTAPTPTPRRRKAVAAA